MAAAPPLHLSSRTSTPPSRNASVIARTGTREPPRARGQLSSTNPVLRPVMARARQIAKTVTESGEGGNRTERLPSREQIARVLRITEVAIRRGRAATAQPRRRRRRSPRARRTGARSLSEVQATVVTRPSTTGRDARSRVREHEGPRAVRGLHHADVEAGLTEQCRLFDRRVLQLSHVRQRCHDVPAHHPKVRRGRGRWWRAWSLPPRRV